MATIAPEPSPRVEQQIIEHLRASSTGIGELLKEVKEIKVALTKNEIKSPRLPVRLELHAKAS